MCIGFWLWILERGRKYRQRRPKLHGGKIEICGEIEGWHLKLFPSARHWFLLQSVLCGMHSVCFGSGKGGNLILLRGYASVCELPSRRWMLLAIAPA